jgi:tetratricopeptide (TPR) repeat protein
MLDAFVLLFAQFTGAWSSSRPPECGDPGGLATNVWERAKSPELRRYCDLVASAASKLVGIGATTPGALEAAREADRILPGHAAPRVLEGRALAALGKYGEALEALGEGRSRDPRALDDPSALLAWARALARMGRHDAAAEAYRALLPRSTALATLERVSAEIEAGLVAMVRGPEGLDEAAAALREAVREAQDEARVIAVLTLALVLDRRGDAEQARTVLSELRRGDPREALTSPRGKELLTAVPAETHALAALGLESSDPAGSRDEWQQAIAAAPSGAWAAHARAHLAALGRKRPGGREGP